MNEKGGENMSVFDITQSLGEETNNSSESSKMFEDETTISAYPTVEFPQQGPEQTISHYKGTMSFQEMMEHRDPLRQVENYRCPPVSFDFIVKEYNK